MTEQNKATKEAPATAKDNATNVKTETDFYADKPGLRAATKRN